jgi:hypothetical protein
LRLGFCAGFTDDFRPLIFAHRARAAAAIFALPAALIFRFLFGAASFCTLAGDPKIRPSSF